MSHDSVENPFHFFEFERDVLHANGIEEVVDLRRRASGPQQALAYAHPHRALAHPVVACGGPATRYHSASGLKPCGSDGGVASAAKEGARSATGEGEGAGVCS